MGRAYANTSYLIPRAKTFSYGKLGRPIRRGIRMANRFARSFTRTKRKRRTNGRGVTFQRDHELIYRKNRMPYRRKKRWVRFIRKTNAVSEKVLGTRTVVRNEQFSFSTSGTSANSTDTLGQLALYPVGNGTHEYLRDLGRIASDPDVPQTGKFLFQSAIMDCTFTNVSSTDDLDRKDIPIELDIYEITAGRNFEKATGDKGLLDVFSEGAADTSTIAYTQGTPVALGLSNRGTTPWDLPQALSLYKVKIWKKTKYRLSGGQSISYQMRDPTRHVFEKGYIGELTGSNLPRATRWLLLIAKPVVGFDVGISGICELATGVTRKYMYKLKEKNEDKDCVLDP